MFKPRDIRSFVSVPAPRGNRRRRLRPTRRGGSYKPSFRRVATGRCLAALTAIGYAVGTRCSYHFDLG